MSKVFVATAFAFAFASCCLASETTPQICAQILSDPHRLECYDLIFKKTAVPDTPAAEKGKWVVQQEQSKLDDSRNVFVFLESEDTAPDRFRQPRNLVLAITCRENKTSLWINFAENFMSDLNGGGRVTYRVDTRQATTRTFTESNDHSVLGLWSGGTAIPFIKDILDGSSLFVRATPFSESAISGTFDIRGLPTAIKPLRDACNW